MKLRKKIAAYLREDGVTKAGLLRELHSMFAEPKPLQSKQFQDFQSRNGPLSDNTSRVYSSADVFFEKLWLKQGKKESKARLGTEKRWSSEGGLPRERAAGKIHYPCLDGGGPTMLWIKYGEIFIL